MLSARMLKSCLGNTLKAAFCTAAKPVSSKKGQISQVHLILCRSLEQSLMCSSKDKFHPSSTLSRLKESNIDSSSKWLNTSEIQECEQLPWTLPKVWFADKMWLILVLLFVFL